MSILFETSWREDFKFYERVFDENLKKSIKREVKSLYEWYEPSSNGIYSSVIDDSVKLEKKQSTSSKDGRDKYGFLDPMYRNIRDNYWGKNLYNLNARTWMLDIETRSGVSYKNNFNDNKLITIRKKSSEESSMGTEITLKELRTRFRDIKSDDYEYYDDITGTWKNLNESIYLERNVGFPVPEKALEEICLMQFHDSITNTMFVLGNREWKHENNYKFNYNVKYINCSNEKEILSNFIKIFKALDPLIIYAWNGDGFDYPYIHNRMKNIGMNPNDLSNYGKVHYSQREFQGKLEFSFKSDGHHFIDMMVIYKNFVFKPRPSYSLNTIAEIELNDKKIEHPEYEKFDDFYLGNYKIPQNPTEHQKNSQIYKEAVAGNWTEVRELGYSDFVYYGIKDTYLLYGIDNKLKFTQLLFMLADKMGVLLSDATATVKPWSQYILNKSYLENKVMPFAKDNPQPNVVGGYVRDACKGTHKWVLSADVNSMYPLLGMVGFNMSPETYIAKHNLPSDLKDIVLTYFNDQNEENRLNMDRNIWDVTSNLLEKYNYSLAINGAIFDKSKLGMIPEMVQNIYSTRKSAKKTMFKYEQQKILIKEIIKEKMNGKN